MPKLAPLSSALLAALAAAGAIAASPAAAQSLVLVAAPIVYVANPMVQPTHQGSAIPGVQPSDIEARNPGFSLHAALPRDTSAQPRWQAPVAVDMSPRNYRRGLADYGPFRVLDGRRVALLGETDARTPLWFRAMLRDYPELAQLDMVECPGTQDDRANLQLGRMIHAARLAVYVPAFGSVRSGAVELFLAGAVREIADGAEFAVHSWRDADGREADDFAPDSPQNRKYFDYYREMGMSEVEARAFYEFTNSVPHTEALWLTASDMRRWTERRAQASVRPARRSARPVTPATLRLPRLEYADASFS